MATAKMEMGRAHPKEHQNKLKAKTSVKKTDNQITQNLRKRAY